MSGVKKRAEVFLYKGLTVSETSLTGTYELYGLSFEEVVTFEGVGPLNTPAVSAVAQV